jgi:hypothetical protein
MHGHSRYMQQMVTALLPVTDPLAVVVSPEQVGSWTGYGETEMLPSPIQTRLPPEDADTGLPEAPEQYEFG